MAISWLRIGLKLKLVSLEPPGNKDPEYVFKIVLSCLWTKWQRKTFGDNIEIATIYELGENYRFFTTSSDPYVGHNLRRFYTFHLKKDTNDGFGKNAWSKNKTRQNAEGITYVFQIYFT